MRRSRAGLLALVLSAAPCAQEKPEVEARLKALRAEIATLQQALDRDRASLDEGRQGLRDIEVKIGETSRVIDGLDRDVATETAALDGLNGERVTTTRALQNERRALARALKAAYLIGGRERLKLLLNQEDLSAFGETLAYFEYLSTARTRAIATIDTQLKRLDELSKAIRGRTDRLSALRAEQNQALQTLEAQKATRRAVLEGLDSRIGRQTASIGEMRSNEERLARLLGQLSDLFADIPRKVAAAQPFRSQKGRLTWPVEGRLLERFGNPRPGGGATWNGLLIGTAASAPVRAVHSGRVAFADWLRGYGLLLILDHGDGYLTLYGHNEALLKGVGDWVDASEPIARAGASGGASQNALYFELRQDGVAYDPRKWFAGALE
jgi:murein hydrolase activator